MHVIRVFTPGSTTKHVYIRGRIAANICTEVRTIPKLLYELSAHGLYS